MTTSSISRNSRPVTMTRRSFVLGSASIAVGSAAVAGCSEPAATTPTDPASAADALSDVLPNFVANNPVPPDFESINGCTPIYKNYPADPVVTVPEPPGNGSSFTLMVMGSGGIPPTLPENAYFAAMNEALNAEFTVNAILSDELPAKVATLLASPRDVPDWMCIPVSAQPPRFDEAVEACFEDLTPYLAGSAVEQYSNLAGITSETWQACVLNGKLMSFPFPRASIDGGVAFYRKDILDELGLMSYPETADDLFQLCTDITDANAGRWGIGSPWEYTSYLFGVVPQWKVEGGELVHRYETDEYKAALEFTVTLFEAGVVHPDALAGGDSTPLFTAGNIVIWPGGLPGWRHNLVNVRDSVPGFDMQVFPIIAADGGTPVYYWQQPAATFNSFVKKGTPQEKIEELVRIANYTAAPFGTKEFEMVRYGLPDIHHTFDANGAPVQTERFQREYRGTFLYPSAPNRPEAEVSLPDYLEALQVYLEDAAQYVVKPEFFGRNIQVPAEVSGLDQQMTDFENDLFAGRKKMTDLESAVDGWRSSGGDELREFYGQYLTN